MIGNNRLAKKRPTADAGEKNQIIACNQCTANHL